MRTKILIVILVGMVVISVVLTAELVAGNCKGKGKGNAPALEKVEFIHWKKGFGKPTCPCDKDGVCEPESGERPSCCQDCKGGGGNGEEPQVTCYAFMGQYGKKLLKWNSLPISYVVHPDVDACVNGAIFAGAEEWDDWTGPEIFNNTYTSDDSVAYNVQDYKNAITFDDYYTDPGIIGACMVWYNPATKQIVEFDIVFETDFAWGYAGPTNEEELVDTSVMDLQNIATHELGHAVGLADVYETECSDVTMFGYSTEGETKKRTLAEADITGIQRLYGAP